MWGGGGGVGGGGGSDSRSSRVFALSDTRALYEALGVDRQATADEVKRAFRALAVRYHPDKNPSGAERFQEASYAYRILSDPEQRALYDASRLRATVDARPSRAMDPSVELAGDELRGFVDSLAREEREAETRRVGFEVKRRREAERRAAFDRENPAFHMPSFAAAAAAAASKESAAGQDEVEGPPPPPLPPPPHHGSAGAGETPYGRRRSAHSPANSTGGSSSSSDGRCGGVGGMPSSSLPAAPTAAAGGGGGRPYPYASAPESYFVSHKPYYNSDVSELRQRTRGFDYRVYIQERKGAHLVSDAILSDALKGMVGPVVGVLSSGSALC